MASEVDICNIALMGLGAEIIRSFDPPEDDKRARVCKVAYGISRDSLLSSYMWTFARKTRELSLLEETHPRWTYVYALPSDCWTPFYISERRELDSWSVEGTALVCNLNPVILRYVFKVTDSERFSPHFVEALAAMIKAKIAFSIVQDPKLQATATVEVPPIVARAQQVDARIGQDYPALDESPEFDNFVNPGIIPGPGVDYVRTQT